MVMQEDAYKIARENASKITREDVLRELELLPVWKLRAPLSAVPIVELVQPVLLKTSENRPEKVEQIEEVKQAEPIESSPIQQVIASNPVLVASDDKKWVFVLPAVLTGQSAELFNNILRALKIKPTQTAHTQQLEQDIADSGASVIVAMGEIAAQQLLTSAETIESLRGKLHLLNGTQVVVTYHPDALLQHLPNKAKTWDDLCMALSVVNA
ncbi:MULTISPECIES: uracil-DNA glycosylase family protein [Methylotenera]|uniref:uracil-DNA glycosylase family protein n=1 Tax=Methylotenera TaxID=359407 RepID=UPI000366EFE4|nr:MULTISPECIES: uracil-DNA glycosylase family protein [Methylotenera]